MPVLSRTGKKKWRPSPLTAASFLCAWCFQIFPVCTVLFINVDINKKLRYIPQYIVYGRCFQVSPAWNKMPGLPKPGEKVGSPQARHLKSGRLPLRPLFYLKFIISMIRSTVEAGVSFAETSNHLTSAHRRCHCNCFRASCLVLIFIFSAAFSNVIFPAR